MNCSAHGLTASRESADKCEDLISRAASLRLEAEFLRSRAAAADEEVVREAYRRLAERWLVLAASLDLQVISELVG